MVGSNANANEPNYSVIRYGAHLSKEDVERLVAPHKDSGVYL